MSTGRDREFPGGEVSNDELPAGDRRLWRALVALYPPSWRSRYGQELLALLSDTAPTGLRASMRTVASLWRGAAGAWLAPSRQLHTAASRQRATVTVLLTAWVTLAAAALVFGQLYEDQTRHSITPGHSISGRLFTAYTAAAHLSVAVLFVGCAPLVVRLVRIGLAARDHRGLALLATPLVVPTLFLAVLAVTSRVVRQPHGGVGAGWFVFLTALGLLAGAGAAGGPLLALRRSSPAGRSVRLALVGLAAAVALMGGALFISVADLATVQMWGPPDVARAPVAVIACYAVMITAVLSVAAVSGVRGLASKRAS